MPTTIIDEETYEEALARRYAEEAEFNARIAESERTRTVKATVPAWITSEYFDPRILIDGTPEQIISGFTYYSTTDMTKAGWVKYGMAEVTLIIHDEREIVSNKIAALKEQKKKVIADAQLEATMIDGKIQELLCLEHKQSDAEE